MLERVSTNRSIILSCLFHKTVIILLTFSSPPSQSFVLSLSVLLLLLLISSSVLLFEGGEEEGIEKNGARIDWLRKNRGMSEQQTCTAVCSREFPQVCGVCNPGQCGGGNVDARRCRWGVSPI